MEVSRKKADTRSPRDVEKLDDRRYAVAIPVQGDDPLPQVYKVRCRCCGACDAERTKHHQGGQQTSRVEHAQELTTAVTSERQVSPGELTKSQPPATLATTATRATATDATFSKN